MPATYGLSIGSDSSAQESENLRSASVLDEYMNVEGYGRHCLWQTDHNDPGST